MPDQEPSARLEPPAEGFLGPAAAHAFRRFQVASDSDFNLALAWSSVATCGLRCAWSPGLLGAWRGPEPAQIGGAGARLVDAADAPLAAEDAAVDGVLIDAVT